MAERTSDGRRGKDTRRRGGAVRLSEIMPAIGDKAFRRFGFVQSAVVSRWPEIVGARYAELSAPESIRFPGGKRVDGVLTLAVAGAHAPMMQHVAPAIIERVNRFFGYPAVARIAIRPGTVARRAVPAPAPARAPLSTEMSDSLRTIADPELRAVLEALAAGVAASAGPPRIG